MGSLDYADPTGPGVRSITVFRDFSNGPPDEFFARPTVTSTASVQGHSGVIDFPPAAPFSAVRIAWKPSPGVTIVVFGLGLTRHEVQAVADGVVYKRAAFAPSPGASLVPCGQKPLVLGALSRDEVMAKSGAVQAKLARVTDLLAQPVNLLHCLTWGCDAPLVVWLVARPATAKEAGATPPPGNTLTVEVLNAATGVSRGDTETLIGLPRWWDQVPDYAP